MSARFPQGSRSLVRERLADEGRTLSTGLGNRSPEELRSCNPSSCCGRHFHEYRIAEDADFADGSVGMTKLGGVVIRTAVIDGTVEGAIDVGETVVASISGKKYYKYVVYFDEELTNGLVKIVSIVSCYNGNRVVVFPIRKQDTRDIRNEIPIYDGSYLKELTL